MARTSGASVSGSGTISDITSTDASVTVTDPTGPTTDLSSATGTVSDITSTGGTITVTGGTGPTANLEVTSRYPGNAQESTISSDISVAASTATDTVSSPTISAGTWLLWFYATIENAGSVAGYVEGYVKQLTGNLSSVAGPIAAAVELSALSTGASQMVVQVLVNATADSTATLSLYSSVACTVKAATPNEGYSPNSGCIAMQV